MRTALALLLVLPAAPLHAAERNYSVTSFDRIRIDGAFEVRLATGVSPYARASGDQAAIDRISMAVEGRTLVIRKPTGGWGGYPGDNPGRAVIELGTHDLTAAWVNGPGKLGIDKIKGLTFELTIQGAGSAEVGAVAVDQLKLGLAGVANARLSGNALKVTGLVRGNSALDASALNVKDWKLGADGAAVARIAASNSAAIEAMGPVTIEVTGSPACTVKASGSGSISGC